eukprot:TRINITY_DN3503_c0_g1_i1.p2 TRINITY_DN3503_c0_g1~~TRINITY_DN3503_c0_g1_i1.p2  ORF type:complete len:761 (+),score=79.40 TRINITY_DN3503_c0_g1_i1:274-2556(+)
MRISISFMYCFMLVLNSKQGLLTVNPYMCLIAGTIFLILIPLHQYGYENVVRAGLATSFYFYCWMIILFQRNFITGSAAIATTSLSFVPIIYLFDRKGQTMSLALVLIFNAVFACVFIIYFPQTQVLVLTPDLVNMSICTNVIGITIFGLLTMYFNSLSNAVYADVKTTNETIENNTKEKERFFATISHEIRNPLQSLLGSIELLQEKKTQNDTESSLMEICKNCCALVINLVSNILDMSKIAADKMQLSPVSANLREIIRKIAKMSQERAQAKNLDLLIIEDPSLPPAIELDTQRIEQIIVNIVSNAIKFTQKGKVVIKLGWTPLADEEDPQSVVQEALKYSSWKETIELSEKPNKVAEEGLLKKYTGTYRPSDKAKAVRVVSRSDVNLESNVAREKQGVAKIEVIDTGIGISKQGIENLFKPYQQADSSISRNYGGTGLGLWITKNIILQMKGDVKIKSKEGRGSNFIIAFPAKVSEEVKAVVGENGSSVIKEAELLKDKTYLLLDDVPENTFILKELLCRNGINSIVRQNGLEALEVYREAHSKIDAIITDLRMPIMSGQAFISEIRKYEQENNIPKVPIIVLTAETSLEEKKLCLTQYGANEFLLKPIKQQDMISALIKVHSNNARPVHKKILIVDDDLISSTFLHNVLTQNGNSCVQAHSLEEAKNCFNATYQIILLDNLLGDGTGLDFIEFATDAITRTSGKMPCVISMSGNTIAEQQATYHGYHIEGYLQKPVRKRELLDLVQVLQSIICSYF